MADEIDARTKPLVTEIGGELRRLRQKVNVTQVDLAKKVKMDPPNLAKIERGEKNVTVDTLRRLAEGLGVELIVRFRAPRTVDAAARRGPQRRTQTRD